MASENNSAPQDESDFPPPLSPAKRKRLQQSYEAANLQSRQENHDYATELFTQCVIGDPANMLYLQGFLGNLKQKYNNNKKGGKLAFMRVLGNRTMVKKASMQKNWPGVFKHGMEVLKVNPWDVPTLKTLAAVCEQTGCYDAQLFYLRFALDADPRDAEINRVCGRALAMRKLYDQAIVCWHRVELACPGDDEAARAIASLTVEKTITSGNYEGDSGRAGSKSGDAAELTHEQRLQREIRRSPNDVGKYVELGDLYLREDQFAKAEEILKRAYEVSNGNVDIRERWEDAQMRHLRQQISDMERTAQESGREEDKRRFKELKRQYLEKDLDFCKNRVERFPNNLAFKFDLGDRFFRMGRYNDAITEYQKAQNDPKRKGLCMLALGQCFQHIKQLNLAMRHYQSAVEDIPDRDAASKKKAYYYAGRLSLYLKDLENAERYLTTLARLDFTYKDVSALLDKIAELRKNTSNQPGSETPTEG